MFGNDEPLVAIRSNGCIFCVLFHLRTWLGVVELSKVIGLSGGHIAPKLRHVVSIAYDMVRPRKAKPLIRLVFVFARDLVSLVQVWDVGKARETGRVFIYSRLCVQVALVIMTSRKFAD